MKKRATKDDLRLAEYLRRNTLHCASVGAAAGANAILERLKRTARPPQWLLASLEGVRDRTERVATEMAANRDEVRLWGGSAAGKGK